MNDAKHWDKIYGSKSTRKVGWYAPHLTTSLSWINELNLEPTEPIIDVGGGASTLVDDLIETGYKDLTVLDLSNSAIQRVQERLGSASGAVTWLQGDITETGLPSQHYRLWHDRAAFHFLIEPETQQKYRDAILRSLATGGYLIIGTFAPDAPPQCSGLPVERYTSDTLSKIFGKEFELIRHHNEIHITPSGIEQAYVYCLFQRKAQ